MRRFVDIDLGSEPAPDKATMCKFWHLPEKCTLAEQLVKAVNQHPSTRMPDGIELERDQALFTARSFKAFPWPHLASKEEERRTCATTSERRTSGRSGHGEAPVLQ